jgi:hypothetical protein
MCGIRLFGNNLWVRFAYLCLTELLSHVFVFGSFISQFAGCVRQVSLLFGQVDSSLLFGQVGFIRSFKFSGSTPYVVHGRIPSVIEEDASFDRAFSGSRRCSNSSHLCARFNATWSLPSVSEEDGIISVKRSIFLSNLVLRVSHADHGLAKLVKQRCK